MRWDWLKKALEDGGFGMIDRYQPTQQSPPCQRSLYTLTPTHDLFNELVQHVLQASFVYSLVTHLSNPLNNLCSYSLSVLFCSRFGMKKIAKIQIPKKDIIDTIIHIACYLDYINSYGSIGWEQFQKIKIRWKGRKGYFFLSLYE